jgi:regulator of RNase E activity RraA
MNSSDPPQGRLSREVCARFLALDDLCSTVSNALDAFGVTATLAASVLAPTLPGMRIAGPALTLRFEQDGNDPHARARRGVTGMDSTSVHDHAHAGDVLVISGTCSASNLGGNASARAQAFGEVGAIVDGAIRDVRLSRALRFPVWARAVTPVTGRWRVRTTAVNDTVTIVGIEVQPGDLVVADADGVCFVPQPIVNEVLTVCESKVAADLEALAEIVNRRPLVIDPVPWPFSTEQEGGRS